jgi:hypothetical protein
MAKLISERHREQLRKIQAKKGEPGRNPLGRSNPKLAAARRLTNFEIAEVGSILVREGVKGLKKMMKDPNISNLQYILCRMVMDARDGDEKVTQHLFDRIAGKVTDKMQIFGGEEKPEGEQMTEAQQLEIAQRTLKSLELSKNE